MDVVLFYSPGIFIFIDAALFILALATKEKKWWNALVTVNILSLVSIAVIFFMGLFQSDAFGALGFYFISVVFAILFGPIYVVLLIINVIIRNRIYPKSTQVNTPTSSTDGRALPIQEPRKNLTPVFLVIALIAVIGFVGISYIHDYFKNHNIVPENGQFPSSSKKELAEMAHYLNNKYNLSVSSNDAIYYLEKDDSNYSTPSDENVHVNIPYFAIFDIYGEEIAVAHRDNTFSDNRQIDEIDYMLADYFDKQFGLPFDYVSIERQNSIENNYCYNANYVPAAIQNGFNDKITSENIKSFIDAALNTDLEADQPTIVFYARKSAGHPVSEYIDVLSKQSDFFNQYKNLSSIKLYYSEQRLSVVRKEPDKTDYSSKSSRTTNSYIRDNYKFGCNVIKAPKESDDQNSIYEFNLSEKEITWRHL